MPPSGDLRELLFGDVPLSEWAGTTAEEPWTHFQDADRQVKRGNREGAQQALATVLAMPDLESRHYLEAWTALRWIGIMPPEEDATHLYGMVLDVPMEGGRDTLAAYEDGTARYINFSGSVIVWETTDMHIGELIADLLEIGRIIIQAVGPWEGQRPALPSDAARISLLTPSGLHFGQGPFDALAADRLAGPAFVAGSALMQGLIERTAG